MQVATLKTAKKALPKIRSLPYSPTVNPLVEPETVQVKKKWVRAGSVKNLTNEDGEVEAVTAIHQIEEVDDAQFVKIFAAGARAMFDLSMSATRVFQVVVAMYQKEPMHGGFSECVYLSWVAGGPGGVPLPGMSESVWNRGMRELVDRRFLSARLPGVFWVNPALMCKGDRVMLVKEYRRKKQSADEAQREALEERGQLRIDMETGEIL
jgi:hypothetical protein